MNFDSVLFVFIAGLVVGGAVVFLLYTRIAVAAAELKAKVDAFERAFGTLKADLSGPSGGSGASSATAAALKAAAPAASTVSAAPAPAASAAAPGA